MDYGRMQLSWRRLIVDIPGPPPIFRRRSYECERPTKYGQCFSDDAVTLIPCMHNVCTVQSPVH